MGADAKPAVPSFTLKEIAQPYDVPPTTTTIVDGYTGEETTITYPGYTVENKTIYIVIKNQPFTSYRNDKGEWISLCYEYSYKPHYSDGGWVSGYPQYYWQSDSGECTFIPFKGLPSRGQIDIRVRALIGSFGSRQPIPPESGDGIYYSFSGVTGDFGVITVSSDMIVSTTLPSSLAPSSVEPINPENPDQSTSTSNPSIQTPWGSYLLTIIITACIITIPIVIVMCYNNHQRKTKTHTNKPKHNQPN